MRNIISLLALIGVFIGILVNCGVGSGEGTSSNNSVLAQTNNTLQKTKDKQGSKLYPYYLDYPVDLSLSGEKLNPILIAIDSFRQDKEIPKEKKNLNKYNFELRQDEDFFFVIMTVKRDPNKIYVGGETKDGIDVTYFVSKKDESVKRAFSK